MAPTPQSPEEEQAFAAGYRLSHPPLGDEVCITGCSGYFPDADSVYELKECLFNKVDMISADDRRWKLAHPEIPQRTGKVNNVNKFDASFFGVHFKQAHTLDPMCRMLLEKTYEAVIDAGVNPKQLKNSRTGVFIGACFSESEKTWFYEKMQVNGFGITGCSRAMLANRISYWLGCLGPSYSVDSACSSSLYALEHAYRAIRNGTCDSAIVGGSNLCLHPYVSLQFSRLGVLSPEGRCKSFDKDASGYVRAEAISVIFLQKAKDSRRVYCQVQHAKTNCDGYKEQGITYPSGHVQKLLLKEFYNECDIDPHKLEFVEAHGTGTRVGDPEELAAIDEVFCTGRKDPLLIGAVKSNLGHSEPASGLCSIAKMCIAYDTGYIPPNINYTSPREGVAGLIEGRIKVVTEKTPWKRGLTGVNSFGFGGANAHVLLGSYAKEKKNNGVPKDDLPRLVCVSGRTESAVHRLLDDIESRPIDVEYVRLLHAIHEDDVNGHVFRGYTLLRSTDDLSKIRVSRESTHYPGSSRPIWFVFSGMGSQWAGMGTQLMRIPIFAAAIQKCHRVLGPKGLDIVDIITNPDPKMFDNILHSFVGIAAVQIGLCDILKAIGIEPDFLIGHSVGELGCAYADGCFTAEQMILSAYSRGLASIETPFIKGSMAAVGRGYQEIKYLCPPDIEVACHNGPESSTISGPAESMKAFVKQLQDQGIFAKEVPCSNIAYHSKYIAEAGPTLLKYLKEVLPEPKLRSPKWYSTSVPQHLWNETEAQYSSAEYHTNNLLSSVLFEETARLIPGNAITIEIAPHGLLQAILRRSLRKECINIPLTKRGYNDNTEFLMTAIGKLYQNGINSNIANLYPKVEFPVSNGTPMLSHLVEWEHSEDWYVTSYRAQEKMKSGERTVRTTIADEDMDFMAGHIVDDRNLYPATGYLTLVWETVAMMMGELSAEVSVIFENVRFQRATNIPKEGNLEFTIMVQKGSGNFEIVEGGAAIVTGKVYSKKDVSEEFRPLAEPQTEKGTYVRTLSTKDLYKEMRLRGYNYSGLFRGIQSCTVDGTHGVLSWVNNWITFLDTMLQMKIVSIDSRGLFVPTRIEKISIDTAKHYAILAAIPDGKVKSLPVKVYHDMDIVRSGGVEIRGIVATAITRRNPFGIPVLEKYELVSNFPREVMSLNDAIRCNIQLVLENIQTIKVRVIESIDSATDINSNPMAPIVNEVLGDMPLIQADVLVLSEEKLDLDPSIAVENKKLQGETNALMVIGSKLLERSDVLQQAIDSLKDKGFIISREHSSVDLTDTPFNVDIITGFKIGSETLVMMKPKVAPKPAKIVHIKESDEKFSWIEEVKSCMKEADKLVLVAQNEPLNGILGLVNCLRKEPGGEIVNCMFINDPKAPLFDLDLPFYEDQLDKDIAINIFSNGEWGTYRHLQLEELNAFPAEHAYVNVMTRGDLSSLQWVEGSLTIEDDSLVHVYYSALNFRDIMTSTGRISVETVARNRLDQECVQGLEISGRCDDGTRVMGMVGNKGIANILKPDTFLLWTIPNEWTLEEAATVPTPYATVFYSLFMIGKLQRGESILIHAGSGGVGQAAIHVCTHFDCEIFTTVGTPEKRALLKKLFPKLKDSHIGNSRDTSFEEMVRSETNGQGVNMVLNSLTDEKLKASIRCLSSRGRFIEIGKFDIVNDTTLGMYFFLKEASFHSIMMDFLFDEINAKYREELSQLVMNGIRDGYVKPLCRVVFSHDEIEASFRYMAAGKHVGKVLIKIREEEPDRNAKPTCIKLHAIPKYICYPKVSYVICGGLGGFGLELADWLVLQGARKLILNSRRGVMNGYQSSRIRAWRSYGAEIIVSTDDITTQVGCVQLLEKANKLGPVYAIFNLAVILKDALFENQTPDAYKESFSPKAVATKYLDIVSRKLCPKLADFVIFSSASCGRGNAGQTNYGMANSIMERICEQRKKDGLPALAVQWGAVGEVGLVADMQDEHFDLEISGTLQQRISSCLRVLDQFLKHRKHTILASMVVAEKRVGSSGSGDIVSTVANIMGLKDMKTISHQVTLAELGMDSMMAVEIKQCLEREFELFLTAQDIRTLTFSKLHEYAAQREEDEQTSSTNRSTEGFTGFKMLLRNIADQLSASEPIVNMSTMIGDGQTGDLMSDVDPVLFMIPGIEGMASALEILSKRLKCKVTVLQLGYDIFNESVEQVAQRLLLSIRSRLGPKANFNILGYSYGCMIALEIAKSLEAEGHPGRLFCIDGAPEFLQKLLRANLDASQESKLQDALLSHIHDILVPKHQENILPKLMECNTWEMKTEVFLKHVPDKIKHSKKYQRALTEVIHDRLKSVVNYDATNFKKIKSPTILLRPKDLPIGVTIDENYGLQQFVENPVTVHLLEGNHITIVDNKDCGNIINRALADLIKEAAATKLAGRVGFL